MPPTAEFRLRFVNGRFGGRFGCNFFGGAYVQSGNVLDVAPLSTTRMACTEEGTAIERDAALILGKPLTMSWTSPDTLELTSRAGGIKLRRVR